MKFVTFNIRYDCGEDGENSFSRRRGLILETIRREEPDLICFQEVLPHVAAWLKECLAGYYVVGCPRERDLTGEQVSVAFRAGGFNLMKMDTYWLSPTPCVPGSRYRVQSPCPRVCTAVTLQETASGKVVRVVNTHLDHEGAEARLLAVRQILERLRKEAFFPEAPVILAGDMNAAPDSGEIRLLCAAMENAVPDVGGTFHNFGREEPVQIDYIFTAGGIRCVRAERWTVCRDGVYLSDHYPVCAELELP